MGESFTVSLLLCISTNSSTLLIHQWYPPTLGSVGHVTGEGLFKCMRDITSDYLSRGRVKGQS
eukprot:292594-Rhodomonas_salina.7